MKKSPFKKRTPLKKKSAKPRKKIDRKPGILILRKQAWIAFSRYIRARDKYICYTCGKDMKDNKTACHAGHYVPQSKGNALRFDERNVHAQCHACNTFYRGNLYNYAIRLEKDYGQGILQELDTIKNERKKFTREELIEMKEYYEQCRKELEDG